MATKPKQRSAANDNGGQPAPLEWRLQAAQVRALRKHPDYGARFLLAGDQNAAKRGPQTIVQAKAAGLTAGEPDLRIYLDGGRLLMIENKRGKRGRLSDEQLERHPALRAIGHRVEVVWADSEEDAARQAIDLVEGALGPAKAIAGS